MTSLSMSNTTFNMTSGMTLHSDCVAISKSCTVFIISGESSGLLPGTLALLSFAFAAIASVARSALTFARPGIDGADIVAS